MKKLYHLFVTRYELHVTSYKLQIERFKRFTSYLLPLTSYLIPLTAFLFLPAAAFAQATVTNVDFSCTEPVTVTYNLTLPASCNPVFVNITLEYSADKCTWIQAETVTGALLNQTTGDGKTIFWDAAQDGVSFGNFYFKVEQSDPILPPEPNPVLINGVYWAPVNLDVDGWFCANPQDFGALYQWGRRADGHECRTSPCWPLSSTCGTTENSPVTSSMLDANGQVICPNPPCGYFIRTGTSMDWCPQNDLLWYNNGKTVNDPCPPGWRVPTKDEFTTLTQTANVTKIWTTNYNSTGGRGWNLTDRNNGNSIFIPSASMRQRSDGNLFPSNDVGMYFSSTPDGTAPAVLYFSTTSASFIVSTNYRAQGGSIRCVIGQ